MNCGKPCSRIVFTSGSSVQRRSLVVAITRILPAFASSTTSPAIIRGTWPAARSVSAGPLPLYAMWMRSVPGRDLQELAGEVPVRSHAGRRVADRARLLLRKLDEAGDVGDVERRMRADEREAFDEVRDRREVLDRVVRQLAIDVGQDRVRAGRVEQQRVAVRRRLRDELRADAAAGAGAVLDDERLAELRAHAVGENPRDAVDAAAGRERNDDAHRLDRIRLRERAPRATPAAAREQQAAHMRGDRIASIDGSPRVGHHRRRRVLAAWTAATRP